MLNITLILSLTLTWRDQWNQISLHQMIINKKETFEVEIKRDCRFFKRMKYIHYSNDRHMCISTAQPKYSISLVSIAIGFQINFDTFNFKTSYHMPFTNLFTAFHWHYLRFSCQRNYFEKTTQWSQCIQSNSNLFPGVSYTSFTIFFHWE